MKGIHVTSEIKPLKKVLLHRPGRELLNLTPNTLEELLFDDIPYLKVADEEHDAQEAKQTFVQHIGSQQDVPEPGEGAAQAATMWKTRWWTSCAATAASW